MFQHTRTGRWCQGTSFGCVGFGCLPRYSLVELKEVFVGDVAIWISVAVVVAAGRRRATGLGGGSGAVDIP